MNKENPLFLPPGSVRAILALTVVMFACIYTAINKELNNSIISLTMLVLSFYFNKRSEVQK